MGIVQFIDSILDRITMYRVALYYLLWILGIAIAASAMGLLPYDPIHITLTALFLVFFSEWINDIFAKAFAVPVNVESTTITALILACIVSPVTKLTDFAEIAAIVTLAVSSKYILALRNKHIFNPVAVAVFVSSVAFRVPATWWIGNPVMAPFVVFGGLLLVRKLRREAMVWSFLGTAAVAFGVVTILKGGDLSVVYSRMLLHSSYLFLAFVMLTEPLTSPPTTSLQVFFAAIVGILFIPDIHVGSIYSTPELALMVGNIYAYIVSPKEKLMLHLSEKRTYASDIADYIFDKPAGFTFTPGQYMEWTLPHERPDSRGNRRYFTIASSPTEQEIRVGIKFYPKSSSYKRALIALEHEGRVVAGQRAGEFVLPKNKSIKLAFIAGGIGVTPYRSITKYLLDTHESRDIVLVYANKTVQEIMYQDVFTQAQAAFHMRTYMTLTDVNSVPPDWTGGRGRVDAAMITKIMPDYKDRLFYLSGPYTMVTAYERILKELGVRKSQIKKDFFPGFV